MTPLVSDDKLQVERTILSWFRTMFVSALSVVFIFKLFAADPSKELLTALLFSSTSCCGIYYSGLKVATLHIYLKARLFLLISISLLLSIISYSLTIF